VGEIGDAQFGIEHLQPGQVFSGILHPPEDRRACNRNARALRKERVQAQRALRRGISSR
jgi:hypothetical protein